MKTCLFCKMASGELRPDVVFESDQVLAFRDIHPQAKTHVLIIPRLHVATLDQLPPDQPELGVALLDAVRTVVAIEGIAQSGYRVVINARGDGGQTVDHLHLHLLGGRPMSWPPG